MGKFVQIIEYSTSKPEEVRALGEQMRKERDADGNSMRVARGLFTADRDRPNVFLNIIEFESYEEAMANSEDPSTQAFAKKMSELVDGPPTFRNLDVQDTWESGGA